TYTSDLRTGSPCARSEHDLAPEDHRHQDVKCETMPLYRIPARTPHVHFDRVIEGESYDAAMRGVQERLRAVGSEIMLRKEGDPLIHFVMRATDETDHYVELCSLGTRTECGTYNPTRATCSNCIKLISARTADSTVLHFHSRS